MQFMDIKQLTFSYNPKIPFLAIDQLMIPKGKVTAIIGPNGSGKSTLLHLLAGLLKPTSGALLLDEQSLYTYTAKERAKKLAVVHQQNDVPMNYTVRKLVEMGRYPHRKGMMRFTTEDDRIVDDALRVTDLIDQQHQFMHQLSGGQRQRVWIALALAQQSEYILLDEPTTYLDMHHQFEILHVIEKMNRMENRTIVMVLHDLNQALQFSDEVIVMQGGEVVAKGNTEEVLTETLIQRIFRIHVKSIQDSNCEKHFIHLKKKV